MFQTDLRPLLMSLRIQWETNLNSVGSMRAGFAAKEKRTN
jgi:hypothetical protein